MTTETKAQTAGGVEQLYSAVRADVRMHIRVAGERALAGLRDLALLGVQVPGLVADLHRQREEFLLSDTAWRGACAERDALQSRVAELTRERDEARETLEKDRSEGRAVAVATIAKAMGVPPESKGLMYFLGRAKALVAAESERDALRAQVEKQQKKEAAELRALWPRPLDLEGDEALSAPPAEAKTAEKRSCNTHDDCDAEDGPCCNDAMCSDHQ